MLAAALYRKCRIVRVTGDDVVFVDPVNCGSPFTHALGKTLLDADFNLLPLGQFEVGIGQIE